MLATVAHSGITVSESRRHGPEKELDDKAPHLDSSPSQIETGDKDPGTHRVSNPVFLDMNYFIGGAFVILAIPHALALTLVDATSSNPARLLARFLPNFHHSNSSGRPLGSGYLTRVLSCPRLSIHPSAADTSRRTIELGRRRPSSDLEPSRPATHVPRPFRIALISRPDDAMWSIGATGYTFCRTTRAFYGVRYRRSSGIVVPRHH